MSSTALWTIRRVLTTRMRTKWGVFQTLGFERQISNGSQRVETALALLLGELTRGAPLLCIHSQRLTEELFGSLRCDCGDQLELAMRAIAERGRGLVIYQHQERRGIGLMEKLQACERQDLDLDMVDSKHVLGFGAECRDLLLPAAILHHLGIGRVRLLPDNRDRARALRERGIDVIARLPGETIPTPHPFGHLRTKKLKLDHALDFGDRSRISRDRPELPVGESTVQG